MKSKDIATLKQMAGDVVDALPCGLMVDGNKNIYVDGKPDNIVNVMTMIEDTRAKAIELNQVIQSIQPRQSQK